MIKLLIAEDERITREYIKFVIEENRLDVQVVEADNGLEAVALAREVQPDLVIMDIRMPELDGLKAGKIIKEEMPFTKVVILTAYEHFSYAQSAIKARLDDYLLKPVSPRLLMETIENQMKGQINYNYDNRRFDDILRLERDLIEAMLQKNDSVARAGVAAIFEGYGRRDSDLEDLKNYLIELTGVIMRRLRADDVSNRLMTERKVDCHARIQELDSVEDLEEEMTAFARDVIRLAVDDFRSEKEKNIHKALAYIADHYQEKVYLTEVARHIGYSSSYFSRLFKEITGKRFSDYLLCYRTERAKKLMDNYQLTLGEIAVKVGFEDFSYFSHVFHKVVGETPSHYRRHLETTK